jgi:DNA polymerase-4
MDFLAPLPVGRLPGVGKVMEGKLAGLGIGSVAELRDYPVDDLERRFGRWGRRLHELSFGIDERPVVSERPTLQISCEDTFADDLLLEELAPHIERLAEKTWASYQRELQESPGRLARTVVLKLKTSDFQILTRSLTPPERPASLAALVEVACALRERVALPSRTRYRLVGVGLSGFIDPHTFDPQAELFAQADA